MKTDLVLMPMGAHYRDMRAAGVAAEEAGFDGIWIWDHFRDPERGAASRVPEVWTVLSALAEVTRRVTLGPLVLNVNLRHPGIVAAMAATLQEVSGGRLLLGLGAGTHRRLPYAAEHVGLGIPIERDAVRAKRVEEACQVMRRLWSGDTSSFAGEHYRLERPEGFLRADPAPPIVVGGFGPRMAGIAGRYADGLNTQATNPQLPELARVAREAHTASGRDPSGFLLTVFGGLRDAYVTPGSTPRAGLEKLGVARLMLLIEPPFDPQRIRAAGKLLGAS